MREESTEFEDGVVIQEFRKGFRIGETLLRPSMVKVSAGPGPENTEPVADGDSDHYCWERPEDMTTPRTTYKLDIEHPGSDLAGETAAAMAAAAIAFRPYSSSYSDLLLVHTKQLFWFADRFRGLFTDSIPSAKEFYTSSCYSDELLWAASWLFRATKDGSYLKYVVDNAASMGGTGWAVKEFSWDIYVGVIMANGNHSPTHSRESQKNGTANEANKHEAVGELIKKKKHAAKGTIVPNVENQLLTKQGDQLQMKQTQPNNLKQGAKWNHASQQQESQTRKCRLCHLDRRTIVAEGTVEFSKDIQMVHFKQVDDKFYKVSIDKVLSNRNAACLPYPIPGATTVM
ncbi:hypothetical protein SSX86_003636 [Deinandra increscens subsp. villosa]|uniref:cellulase n=1 Tax=Deinandra increscens subsp. villosa TaxID=3103831 RepID=A0AAP0H580_9ASTR